MPRPGTRCLVVHDGDAVALLVAGILRASLRFPPAREARAGGVLRVDLAFDTVQNAVTEKKIEFLPVASDIPEDAAIYAQVADDLARADQWLGIVVGKTKTVPLDSDLIATARSIGISFGD